MTTNTIVGALAAWLALQIPIGMVVGHYMRRARTLATISIGRKSPEKVRRERYAACHRASALLRG